MALADNYLEIMRYRNEALSKYRTNLATCAKGPVAYVAFPRISLRHDLLYAKKLGPLSIGLQSAITGHVMAELRSATRPLNVLEIGPGGGELADLLVRTLGSKIRTYWALDRDPTVRGPFTLLKSLDDITEPIDLVIASEVIEHMSADIFFETLLSPIRSKLSSHATAVFSTPNALSPAGISRDFTHVQGYPWYDLYAIMRLIFDSVDITRSTSLWSFGKLLLFYPRKAICFALDLDWCEQLVCVGRVNAARAKET
jgi:hypothetical protein